MLPYLVGWNQSAFVQDRRISDNILLAHELVKNYQRKGLSPREVIKIDLRKAFDAVDWNFLINMLEVKGFPTQYIHWIRGCVTSPWFSVSINGCLTGFFKGKRGLRQGDPLSLYLFMLSMEVLTWMLDKAAVMGNLRYHPKCKGLKLTHICFSDDLLVFTNCSRTSFDAIKEVLNAFYHLSGLRLNAEKTENFHSSINEQMVSELEQSSGFKSGALLIRYLGVPLISTRLSAKDCSALINKITARISSWTTKSLSFAGILQFISFVL